MNFPEAVELITPEEAAQKWLEKASYKLSYFFPISRDGREIVESRLIYLLDDGFGFIDAVTGQPLTHDGRTAQVNEKYNFEGSWAAEPLQLLAKSNLLPTPDKFAPTSPVNRRDAIKVLMSASVRQYRERTDTAQPSFQDVRVNDPDYGAVEVAVKMGVIDKGNLFNPDQPLTRKVLATWLVNLVGFKDIASIPNKITTPFEDLTTLSEREQNYIGLAYGLGFMQGDGSGMFRPIDQVTWEEFATVLLKSLPRIDKTVMY